MGETQSGAPEGQLDIRERPPALPDMPSDQAADTAPDNIGLEDEAQNERVSAAKAAVENVSEAVPAPRQSPEQSSTGKPMIDLMRIGPDGVESSVQIPSQATAEQDRQQNTREDEPLAPHEETAKARMLRDVERRIGL